jgi:hypothetical protein
MNDAAFLTHEIIMRDPETLKMYRVEVEHATLYATEIRLTLFTGAVEVSEIRIRISNGELRINEKER